MDHGSQPTVVRIPRRARLVIGAFTMATSLTGAAAWAVGAAASPGTLDGAGLVARPMCTPAEGRPPSDCWPQYTTAPPTSSPSTSVPPTTSTSSPPTTSGPVSTRTSYTWTFDDGTPGSWYGYSSSASSLAPWVAPSPAAAASGPGGVLVGAVSHTLDGAAVDVDRTMLAPGTYAASARVRLAPGQPATSFEISGPRPPMGTGVTDGAWTTLTGSVVVPADGTAARLVVGPGDGYCWAPNRGDYAPATSFQLDEVSLTRSAATPSTTSRTASSTASRTASSTTSSTTPSTTLTTGGGCPTYSAAPPATAKIHYEVTGTTQGGFAATLVLTNLRDTPITGWAVRMNQAATAQRITWVSGARPVTTSTATSSQTRLLGPVGAPDIPARGQVRISLGLTGSPVGSASLFTVIEGQQTGRN